MPETALKAYLAKPINIIVGGADNTKTAHLNNTPPAIAQGINRLNRAKLFRQQAQTEAAHRGIKFC